MKLTIELPETSALAFLNLAYMNNGTMMLGSVSIDSNDIKTGHVNVVERLGCVNDDTQV